MSQLDSEQTLTREPNQPAWNSPPRRFPLAALEWLGTAKVGVCLLGLLTVALAIATATEGNRGPTAARDFVYDSWWFVGLFGLLFLNVLAAVIIRFPWSRDQSGFLITHTGLLILLAGMGQSFLGNLEGRMTLSQGDRKDHILLLYSDGSPAAAAEDVSPLQDSDRGFPLGFSVQLLQFRREKNPGGSGDAAYLSRLRLADSESTSSRVVEVAMNQPQTYEGFKLFQVDFRQSSNEETVVTLGVSHDPGRVLKYLGAALVCLGTALMYLAHVRDLSKPLVGPPECHAAETPPHRATGEE